MAEPRLTTGLWVSAYRRRLDLLNIPAFVTRKGDETAGAVLVKLSTLDGVAKAFHRTYNLDTGARIWDILALGLEAEVDEAIDRQRTFDPDLWVIEVEDRAGRHLLGEEGLD